NELGLLFDELGRLDESVAAFRRAVECQPTDAVVHANLADGLVKQEQLESAAAEYRESLRLDPAQASTRHRLADVYQRLHRLDQAVAVSPGGLARDGVAAVDRTESRHRLGQLYQDHGRHDEAVAVFRKCLDLDAEDFFAWHRLGVSLEKTDRLDDAL